MVRDKNISKILHHSIFLQRNTIIIVNELLRFYLLIYMRIQYLVSRVIFDVDLVNLLIYLSLILIRYGTSNLI